MSEEKLREDHRIFRVCTACDGGVVNGEWDSARSAIEEYIKETGITMDLVDVYVEDKKQTDHWWTIRYHFEVRSSKYIANECSNTLEIRAAN
jgi:hypothetical protein